MFNGFDYGKGLKKQVEAHKRGPASQRQRRSDKLVKLFDAYCKKFIEALNNSGSTNPGLLKNAAEVIVESAKELRYSGCAYQVFAEMVNRSRKVPVIPGLSGLVDSLLELETEQKTERLSLLNWRITTGNMRVDRYLDYQSQRARLSGNAEHWKDFCWGLLQVVQKGTVKPHDGPALAALEVLQKKQHELGDRIIDVLMLLAEARYSQKNLLEMEKCLLEVATRTAIRAPEFFSLLDLLLDERADTCWELHQLSINNALEAVAAGKLGWSTAEAIIGRARKHKEKRLDYLLEHDLMVVIEPLGTHVFEAALNLPESKVHQALLRWRYAYSSREVDLPESIKQAYRDAKQKGYTGLNSVPTVVHPTVSAAPAPAATNPEAPAPVAEPIQEVPMPAPPAMAKASQAEEEPDAPLFSAEDSPALLSEVEYAVAEEEPVPAVATELVEAMAAASAGEPTFEAEAPYVEVEPEPPEPVAEEPQADEPEPAEPEVAAEPTLIDRLLACANAREFKGTISAAYPLSAEDIELIESGLADGELTLKPWLVFETLLEVAKWHMMNKDRTSAEDSIRRVEVPPGIPPKQVITRIAAIFGDSLPDSAAQLIISQQLAAGEFLSAIVSADRISDAAERELALNTIQDWLLEQDNPTPLIEIAAAEIQRKLSGDPAAELESALRASLLAPDDTLVQQLFAGWQNNAPAAQINLARARIATRLCSDSPSESMVLTAASAIAALLEEPGDDAACALARELASELRPVLESYGLDEELAELLEDKVAESEPLAEEPEAVTEEEPVAEEVAAEEDEEPDVAAVDQHEELEVVVTANGHADIRQPEMVEAAVGAHAEHSFASAAAGEVHDWGAAAIHSDIAGHLSAGDWHGAGHKAGELYSAANNDDVTDLTGIYHSLPTEAMLPFSEGLAKAFADLEEYNKLIDVLNLIDVELNNGKGELRNDAKLQSFIDGTLHSLCEKAFEERFDAEFDLSATTDCGRQAINDLLILARSGDKTAGLTLHKAFVAILKSECDAPLLQVIADVLAPMLKETAPQQSLKLVAQAGLAVNDSRWALSRIDDLELTCTDAESCLLLGQLQLAKNDLPEAFAAIEKLITLGDSAGARKLLTQLGEQSVGKVDPMVQLTRMYVLLDPPDYETAFDELLEVYQLVSESGINLKLALAPLSALFEDKACSELHEPQVCKFQLLLHSLLGDPPKVLSIVEDQHNSAPGGAEMLLRAIDRIAMHDNAIPPLTVIGWAKALLLSGRTAEALDKLAGIADSGVEYHAYTQLLEEAKRQCESADAHMQLAQAYLRNHLWMRSADEYRQALAKDPEMCEPILTQLKRWSALELDPIKHPIHFLAVQATAHSTNLENWQWALTALPRLRESWPPKNLHDLALDLWHNHGRTNLDGELVASLVETLIELAIDSNNIESATSLLIEVWEPNSALAHAMRPVISSIEKRLRTADTALLFQFRKILLEDAIAEEDAPRMAQAAQELAGVSEQGRMVVTARLCAETLPPNLAGPAAAKALELLRLDDPREQQEFMKLLARLQTRDLPINVTRALIRAAVGLMRQKPVNPGLEASVFHLLRSIGDDQRCSSLAAYLALDEQALVEEAKSAIAELAAKYNSPQHALMMAEIGLASGAEAGAVYDWLARAGGKLDHDYAVQVTALAHALACTPAAPLAHAGLSLAYRKTGNLDRAAEEMLWAKLAGSELDASWLIESTAANLGFYSALLLLSQGQEDAGVARLQHVVETGAADADIVVAARMRLAQHALEHGKMTEAFSLAEAAKAMSPRHPLANEMIDSLKQEIFRERLEAARVQEEGSDRTLLIAQLHKENGEITEAISELQSGLRKGFASESLFLELAECFAVSGQHNISRRAYYEALKRLEQRNGDSELMIRALYGLAQEDIELGNSQEAISNLEYLLLIKSDYRDAHELIERLYQNKLDAVKPSSPDLASQVLEQIIALLDHHESQHSGEGQAH